MFLKLALVFAGALNPAQLDQVSYAEFRRRVDVLTRQPDPDIRLVRSNLLLPSADNGSRVMLTQFDRLFSSNGDGVEANRLACQTEGVPAGRPVGSLVGYLRELVATPQVLR
jgi:hypothetical protein